jgi:hypothetical protein
MNGVLLAAILEYLCRHRIVGALKLADDMMKRKDVRQALGLAYVPPLGSEEWWRIQNVVMKAVKKLEEHGLVSYNPASGFVRWEGGRCV